MVGGDNSNRSSSSLEREIVLHYNGGDTRYTARCSPDTNLATLIAEYILPLPALPPGAADDLGLPVGGGGSSSSATSNPAFSLQLRLAYLNIIRQRYQCTNGQKGLIPWETLVYVLPRYINLMPCQQPDAQVLLGTTEVSLECALMARNAMNAAAAAASTAVTTPNRSRGGRGAAARGVRRGPGRPPLSAQTAVTVSESESGSESESESEEEDDEEEEEEEEEEEDNSELDEAGTTSSGNANQNSSSSGGPAAPNNAAVPRRGRGRPVSARGARGRGRGRHTRSSGGGGGETMAAAPSLSPSPMPSSSASSLQAAVSGVSTAATVAPPTPPPASSHLPVAPAVSANLAPPCPADVTGAVLSPPQRQGASPSLLSSSPLTGETVATPIVKRRRGRPPKVRPPVEESQPPQAILSQQQQTPQRPPPPPPQHRRSGRQHHRDSSESSVENNNNRGDSSSMNNSENKSDKDDDDKDDDDDDDHDDDDEESGQEEEEETVTRSTGRRGSAYNSVTSGMTTRRRGPGRRPLNERDSSAGSHNSEAARQSQRSRATAAHNNDSGTAHSHSSNNNNKNNAFYGGSTGADGQELTASPPSPFPLTFMPIPTKNPLRRFLLANPTTATAIATSTSTPSRPSTAEWLYQRVLDSQYFRQVSPPHIMHPQRWSVLLANALEERDGKANEEKEVTENTSRRLVPSAPLTGLELDEADGHRWALWNTLGDHHHNDTNSSSSRPDAAAVIASRRAEAQRSRCRRAVHLAQSCAERPQSFETEAIPRYQRLLQRLTLTDGALTLASSWRQQGMTSSALLCHPFSYLALPHISIYRGHPRLQKLARRAAAYRRRCQWEVAESQPPQPLVADNSASQKAATSLAAVKQEEAEAEAEVEAAWKQRLHAETHLSACSGTNPRTASSSASPPSSSSAPRFRTFYHMQKEEETEFDDEDDYDDDEDVDELGPSSISIPIVVGGCVQLVNPDSKDASHRWTVYVRGLYHGSADIVPPDLFPVHHNADVDVSGVHNHPGVGVDLIHHHQNTDMNLSGRSASATASGARTGVLSSSGGGTTTVAGDEGGSPAAPQIIRSDYLAHFISRVVFILDRSFVPCVRTVSQPPFELTEVGWGEFVVTIHIHLKYAAFSRASNPLRNRLMHYYAHAAGEATLANSTGQGRGTSAADPLTSMVLRGNSVGRGQHAVTTNTDNRLVHSLHDIHYNGAARAILYRGPTMNPFLNFTPSYGPEETIFSEADQTLMEDYNKRDYFRRGQLLSSVTLPLNPNSNPNHYNSHNNTNPTSASEDFTNGVKNENNTTINGNNANGSAVNSAALNAPNAVGRTTAASAMPCVSPIPEVPLAAEGSGGRGNGDEGRRCAPPSDSMSPNQRELVAVSVDAADSSELNSPNSPNSPNSWNSNSPTTFDSVTGRPVEMEAECDGEGEGDGETEGVTPTVPSLKTSSSRTDSVMWTSQSSTPPPDAAAAAPGSFMSAFPSSCPPTHSSTTQGGTLPLPSPPVSNETPHHMQNTTGVMNLLSGGTSSGVAGMGGVPGQSPSSVLSGYPTLDRGKEAAPPSRVGRPRGNTRRGPGRRPGSQSTAGSPTTSARAQDASGNGEGGATGSRAARRPVTVQIGHKENVVVVSHLLRFSERLKLPPCLPPFNDIRGGPQRGPDLLVGYAVVPEPVVTESYDEIVVPLRTSQLRPTRFSYGYAGPIRTEDSRQGRGRKRERSPETESGEGRDVKGGRVGAGVAHVNAVGGASPPSVGDTPRLVVKEEEMDEGKLLLQSEKREEQDGGGDGVPHGTGVSAAAERPTVGQKRGRDTLTRHRPYSTSLFDPYASDRVEERRLLRLAAALETRIRHLALEALKRSSGPHGLESLLVDVPAPPPTHIMNPTSAIRPTSGGSSPHAHHSGSSTASAAPSPSPSASTVTASVAPGAPSPPTPNVVFPGRLSCWNTIASDPKAAARELDYALAYLNSITSSARAEGWLHTALDFQRERLFPADPPAPTRARNRREPPTSPPPSTTPTTGTEGRGEGAALVAGGAHASLNTTSALDVVVYRSLFSSGFPLNVPLTRLELEIVLDFLRSTPEEAAGSGDRLLCALHPIAERLSAAVYFALESCQQYRLVGQPAALRWVSGGNNGNPTSDTLATTNATKCKTTELAGLEWEETSRVESGRYAVVSYRRHSFGAPLELSVGPMTTTATAGNSNTGGNAGVASSSSTSSSSSSSSSLPSFYTPPPFSEANVKHGYRNDVTQLHCMKEMLQESILWMRREIMERQVAMTMENL